MARLIETLSAEERVALVTHMRGLVGTPFVHRGRTSRGLDCIGAIAVCFLALGHSIQDRRIYGRDPETDKLRESLQLHFGDPVTDEPQPGDVALMAWTKRPQHVAMFGDYLHGGLSLIHTDSLLGSVTEHRYAAPWPSRVVEIYRP